jgi:hypothetical protein
MPNGFPDNALLRFKASVILNLSAMIGCEKGKFEPLAGKFCLI